MNPVFADTVGLIALWDRSDQWHDAAEAAFNKLAQVKTPFVTSAYILLETGNAAARRPYRLEVDRLRQELERSSLLIHPTTDDWRLAWEAYCRRDAGGAGIVDHTSFLIMERLGIRRAFTNDRHFRAAGFDVLF